MQMEMDSFFRFLLGVLAFATFKLAAASLNIETAGVKVVYPSGVSRNIVMAMADFGLPRYGGLLQGELVYVSTVESFYRSQTYTCCPRGCQYGCDLSSASPRIAIPRTSGTAYIMMLDRGPRDVSNLDPCYFLDKVYNAQMIGADAVLIADDREGEITTATAPDTDDVITERSNITIPAGMIAKEDAEFLRDQLRNNGRVHLILNWTSTVPKSQTVSWEYWTGTADVCGSVCIDRVNFTTSMSRRVKSFEQAELPSFTPRYFLYSCMNGTENETECQANCFSNGRYCAHKFGNFTGKDVLRMNIRAKCFFNLASLTGHGYLWWDYMTMFFQNCRMDLNQYNVECARQVFNQTLYSSYNISAQAWEDCSTNFNETDLTIDILEADRISQFGNDASTPPIAPVVIEPTIRINGVQYRGSLRAGPVMRALCAAFPTGHEPVVCNENWVTEDECASPNGDGYIKCGVGKFDRRTGCINTFQGYQCTCGEGFQVIFNPSEGSEACTDINECTVSSAPYRNSNCSCARCACINTPGSYECSGAMEDQCTPQNNYGGCWAETHNGRNYTTCVDTIGEYKEKSRIGTLNKTSDTWYRCGECPKCFRSTGKDTCELMCDLSLCDGLTGFCRQSESGGAGGNGSGKSPGKSGGVNTVLVLFVALGAAALTGFLVMMANRITMKKRMSDEIRDIMASYMPLQEERSRNAAVTAAREGGRSAYQERIIRPDEDSDEEGQVGAYGWSTGRPAAVPTAAAASQAAGPQRAKWGPPSAEASTAPISTAGRTFASPSFPGSVVPTFKPVTPELSVDAFGEANNEQLRPTAPPAADTDPLLGSSGNKPQP